MENNHKSGWIRAGNSFPLQCPKSTFALDFGSNFLLNVSCSAACRFHTNRTCGQMLNWIWLLEAGLTNMQPGAQLSWSLRSTVCVCVIKLWAAELGEGGSVCMQLKVICHYGWQCENKWGGGEAFLCVCLYAEMVFSEFHYLTFSPFCKKTCFLLFI